MKVVHYIKTGVESLLTISDHSVNFFDISRYSNASTSETSHLFPSISVSNYYDIVFINKKIEQFLIAYIILEF